MILGVRTNLEHLQAVLDHPAFRAGELSTAFLEEHLADWPGARPLPDVALAAAALPTGTAARGRGTGSAGLAARDPWAALGGFRVGEDGRP